MSRTFAAIACLLVLATPAMSASSLPGGATSLTETHDDWTVRCDIQNALVHCAAQQEQLSNQTKQRVLAIELLGGTDVLTGTLVLPFGLLLSKGAVIRADDKLVSPVEPFQTCVPSGCLVPLQIGADWESALRTGVSLNIAAVAVSGEEAKFAISLKGLASALDRVRELTK